MKIKLDASKIKLYSQIGTRATFGLACIELLKEYQNLMICTADVSTSAGLDRFRKKYPNNYVDVGIAEQNLIGVATGLSELNFKVITTTFSPFQTLRCLEQIKVNLGYMKNKIIMVGLASGLVLGPLGFTHASIEDVGALRSIPNINIICPSDSGELIKTLEQSILSENSTYIRLTGGANNKVINDNDYNFEMGKSIELLKGDEICIISNGQIISECLEAAKKLNDSGVSTTIINMHTIKPIDENKIREISKNYKLIVTVEEHNIIGGLGSAVSEVLSNIKNSPPLVFIGVNDYYEKGGNYFYLKNKYSISSDKIFKKIINSYEHFEKI